MTFLPNSANTQAFNLDSSKITSKPLLEVKDLSVSLIHYGKGLQRVTKQIIHNLDLTIHQGEIVAVVGASGSGKSILANTIMGMIPEDAIVTGSILYKGNLLTRKEQSKLLGKSFAFIPQSVKSLDPLMKVGKQVRIGIPPNNKNIKEHELFPSRRIDHLYPYELSGGMARQVLVSGALFSEADLIIADEPTPGLDQILMEETKEQLLQVKNNGRSVLFITHDLRTAKAIADKIIVLYAGTTIEVARNEDFSGNGEKLRHPYSKALWASLPENDFKPLEGSQPLPDDLPMGCLFVPRCIGATEVCLQKKPKLRDSKGGRVRCFHA
jgi:peptide/nickel transport system ATP-binding protein